MLESCFVIVVADAAEPAPFCAVTSEVLSANPAMRRMSLFMGNDVVIVKNEFCLLDIEKFYFENKCRATRNHVARTTVAIGKVGRDVEFEF